MKHKTIIRELSGGLRLAYIKSRVLILIVLLLGTLASPAIAAVNAIRPFPEKGPTEVTVSIFVLDIDEVNTAAQNFDANVYFKAAWRDPRLAHEGTSKITRSLHEVWNPRVQFVNQQKVWTTFPEVVEISPGGDVVYQQRVWGTFSQPLELRDFPFDNQFFRIQLGSAGYNTQEIRLIPDINGRNGISKKFSLADWDIVTWNVKAVGFTPNDKDDSFATFQMEIEATRRYVYFIIKVIIPLFLIVMMSWVVFWIDPKESGTQISVAITTMLTLIAYRFAVGSDLPKVSYLTRLDYFILGATLLVFTSLIEVVVTSTYAKIGNIERARVIDRWARIVFPSVFIAIALEALVFRFVL